MKGFKPRLATASIVAALALTVFGFWGMLGKGTRAVDVLAIFAGGFAAGVSSLKLLQIARDARRAERAVAAAPPASPARKEKG